MSDSKPKCHCEESGYYHCSVLREKLEEMRSIIKVILEADCLKSHAFESDDDLSIYDLCKSALKWPGEE